MADFGDPSLFSEFEKPREPSDRILLENVLTDASQHDLSGISQEESEEESSNCTRKTHGTADESSDLDNASNSEDSDSDSERDAIDNGRTNGDITIDQVSSSGTSGPLHLSARNGSSTLGDNIRNEEINKSINKLKQENEFLKKQLRLLDPLSWINDEQGPAMQLIFMQHDFAREYKSQIEDFISNLMAESKSEGGKKLGPLRPRPNDICLAAAKDMGEPMRRILRLRTSMVLNCCQMYEDFIIDAMGCPLVDFNPALTDGWEIPKYEQVFTHCLPCSEEDEGDAPQPKRKRATAKCFNCNGEHTLAQCPEPKDFAKIKRSRQEFKNSNSGGTPRQTRYIASEPRFASFKPGVISDSLREALGLSENQLPPFIYAMRGLGYPPGWLEEAKKESGLAMYDREGRELDVDGELLEDGEMNEDRIVTKDEYDIEKFVKYPGFNTSLPEGTIDEAQYFGAMPLHPGQDISIMQLRYQTPNSRKRKKDQHEEGVSAKKRRDMNDSISDMDIDNSEMEEEVQASSQASTAPGTPAASLEELEKQKELLQLQLLAAAADEESSQADTAPSSPVRSARSPVDSTTPSGTVLSTTPSGTSLSASLGTPIIHDIGKKKTSLPDSSKFRKDIEEHIPYENLPDAVGSFEKIRTVMVKIKELKKASSS